MPASACGHDGPQAPTSEVRATQDCPPPRCISHAQAEEQLGFPVWEPSELPQGYALYSRTVSAPGMRDLPRGGDIGSFTPGPAPTLTTGRRALTLQLDYRFHQSLYVPGIVVSESALGPPGTTLTLVVPDITCGESIEKGALRLIYVYGAADVEPTSREGEFNVCRVPETPERNLHTVLLVRGQILIEVLAFGEGGVSKEEVITLAGSFAEAE
jgi:hypothetical protein